MSPLTPIVLIIVLGVASAMNINMAPESAIKIYQEFQNLKEETSCHIAYSYDQTNADVISWAQ